MAFAFTVNGFQYTVDVEPETPLLWVLRDTIDSPARVRLRHRAVRGVHGASQRPSRALVLPSGQSRRRRHDHHDRRAVGRWDAPGAAGVERARRAAMRLLSVRDDHGRRGAAPAYAGPTDDDIDDGVTNACRCGTYHRVRQAIHRAAALMSASPSGSVEEKR